MFAPKWKKEAKLLDKAAKKFLNYKRDLLSDQQIAEIQSRRDDLKAAAKSNDKEKTAEASKQLQATCESSLPRYQSQGWLEENIEVFFVAIVVALGLRAYVVQPFRIPTGSMQPTLNGIIAHSVESSDDIPSLPVKAVQWATHGRSYVDLVLDEDKELRRENPVIEVPTFHFFTRTKIFFTDGTSVTFPGPKTALMNANGMGFGKKVGYPTNDMTPGDRAMYEIQLQTLRNPQGNAHVAYDVHGNRQIPYLHPTLKKGTVIARGYIDSGDLILVDKMSYHFRRPTRGEVFVFDTRNIKRIHEEAKQSGGVAGSHYIKRLAGLPGDELEIKGFDLYINGKRAQEPGFLKVMSQKEGYKYGYKPSERLAHGKTFKAHFSKQPGMNQYIALGDNSFNSSDSRHWGTVKEYNVIGPASVVLWPFASGHWGLIK